MLGFYWDRAQNQIRTTADMMQVLPVNLPSGDGEVQMSQAEAMTDIAMLLTTVRTAALPD